MARWITVRIAAAIIAVICLCGFSNAYSTDGQFCTDLKYLIEQSKSRFLTIRGNTKNNDGGHNAKFMLTDAQSCQVREGLNAGSYQCSWKFEYASEQANLLLEKLTNEIIDCIGSLYKEQVDKSVNHPDFYLAYYYEFPGGQVNLALKNKAVTMNTYVSVRVDGFK